MKSPLEDTIWGAVYGSVAAVQAAFDRFGPEYHEAILATGAPAGAARAFIPHLGRPAQGIDLGCGSGVLGLALKKRDTPRRSTVSIFRRSCCGWRLPPTVTVIFIRPIFSGRKKFPDSDPMISS